MTEGAAYVASWVMRSQDLPIWGSVRGDNLLDGGSFFYDTYETKDKKFMSVGAIEPQFFKEFVNGLGLDINQFGENDTAKLKVTEKFKTKTQREWTEIFEDIDACVFPVVEWEHAKFHRQNESRESFVKDTKNVIPIPAPILSRTPAKSSASEEQSTVALNVESILNEIGVKEDEIRELCSEGVLLFESKL